MYMSNRVLTIVPQDTYPSASSEHLFIKDETHDVIDWWVLCVPISEKLYKSLSFPNGWVVVVDEEIGSALFDTMTISKQLDDTKWSLWLYPISSVNAKWRQNLWYQLGLWGENEISELRIDESILDVVETDEIMSFLDDKERIYRTNKYEEIDFIFRNSIEIDLKSLPREIINKLSLSEDGESRLFVSLQTLKKICHYLKSNESIEISIYIPFDIGNLRMKEINDLWYRLENVDWKEGVMDDRVRSNLLERWLVKISKEITTNNVGKEMVHLDTIAMFNRSFEKRSRLSIQKDGDNYRFWDVPFYSKSLIRLYNNLIASMNDRTNTFWEESLPTDK